MARAEAPRAGRQAATLGVTAPPCWRAAATEAAHGAGTGSGHCPDAADKHVLGGTVFETHMKQNTTEKIVAVFPLGKFRMSDASTEPRSCGTGHVMLPDMFQCITSQSKQAIAHRGDV